MSSPAPAPVPNPPDDFRLAIERLRALTVVGDSGARFLQSRAITQFSDLGCSFVPTGQSDTDVRDEVRRMLRGSDVASVVDAIRGSFDRRRAIHAADQLSPGWAFLDYPDVAGRAATEAALEPMLVYWLRLAAFCLVVAYGPAGAALPPLPLTADEELKLPKQRHARVPLALVPGDEPRDWFGDDGEAVSGLPDAEHDPDDPKSTGWWA